MTKSISESGAGQGIANLSSFVKIMPDQQRGHWSSRRKGKSLMILDREEAGERVTRWRARKKSSLQSRDEIDQEGKRVSSKEKR